MREITRRRRLCLLITVMVFVLLSITAYAATQPSDISNHWAEGQINEWVNKGLVSGYEDGTFKPNNDITRAEFMALVNRAFKYQEKAEIDYQDVKAGAWYADTVKIAKAAGYINGYPDGTMKPNASISRQEAATIIMKINKLEENASGIDRFKDALKIAAWSKGAVGAVASANIMGGYPDGTFKAGDLIKRAEAVVALDKALKNSLGVIYDKAGTYGPLTGSEVIKGNVIITAKNVTLQNMVIEGDLTIDKAVGEGDAYLKNITVKGNTYVYGGGVNSVYFIDSQTGKIYVLKDAGPVRVVISGTSEISELIAQSSVTVEEKDLTGDGLKAIVVDKKVDGSIIVDLSNVKVDTLTVKTKGATVITNNNTIIGTLIADAAVDVKGTGKIEKAEINASGITFDTKPEVMKVAPGVSAPTINTPPSSGGGGGGISSEQQSRNAFNGKALNITKITDPLKGDLADIAFNNSNYTAKITITNNVATIFDIAGTGLFATILPELGVKEVKFGAGIYNELDSTDEYVLLLEAYTVLEPAGTPLNLVDLVGKSITFTAKIQPAGHVTFEQVFTVTFE